MTENNSIENISTPSHSPIRPVESRPPSVFEDYDVGDDSINGLVDSMLQEASALAEDPCTPDSHTTTFTIAHDPELMTGGDEGGVPLGRTHHSDRAREFHLHHEDEITVNEMHRMPGSFDKDTYDNEEPSFSSISLSTPPKQKPIDVEPQPKKSISPPVDLPPDTEVDEVGIPLGRTHHSERARQAREEENDPKVEKDVQMLPGSPSPPRRYGSAERKKGRPSNSFMPKLDLGFSFGVDDSKSFVDGQFFPVTEIVSYLTECSLDFFGGDHDIDLVSVADLQEEHPELDQSVLSNTSIASFHDYPPQIGNDSILEGDGHDLSREMSGILSAMEASASMVREETFVRERTATASSNEVEVARADDRAIERRTVLDDSSEHQESPRLPPIPSPIEREDSSGRISMSGSIGRRSPRIDRENVKRRLVVKRSRESITHSLNASPATSPKVDPSPGQRLPLGERLKRVLSPTIPSASISNSPTSATRQPTSLSLKPELPQRAHTFDFDSRGPQVGTPVSATFDLHQPGVDIADMRSALDRLVEDVSKTEGIPTGTPNTTSRLDRSNLTMSDGDYSLAETDLVTEESTELLANLKGSLRGKGKAAVIERSSTVSGPSLPSTFSPEFSLPVSRVASTGSIPPQLPPKESNIGKTARQEREELIKEKRREARLRDSGEYFVPPKRNAKGTLLDLSPASKRHSLGNERPSRRRSLSTGDVEDLLSNVSELSILCLPLLSDANSDFYLKGCQSSTTCIRLKESPRRGSGNANRR